MEKKTLKQRIKENPGLKQAVHRFIMHPVKTRPNWWIRLFDFIYLKRGKGSVIYRSVRKDLPPFNRFFFGKIFCCRRFLLSEQCSWRLNNRRLYTHRIKKYNHRSGSYRQPRQSGTECNSHRTQPQLPGCGKDD